MNDKPKPEDETTRPAEHKSTIPTRLWVWCFAIMFAGYIAGFSIMDVGEKTGNTLLMISGFMVVLGTIGWMPWRIYRNQLPVMLNYLPDPSNDRFCFSVSAIKKAAPIGVIMMVFIMFRDHGDSISIGLVAETLVATVVLLIVFAGFGGHFAYHFLRWRAVRWQESRREQSGEKQAIFFSDHGLGIRRLYGEGPCSRLPDKDIFLLIFREHH